MPKVTEYQEQYLSLIREVIKRLTRIADSLEQMRVLQDEEV